MSSEGSDLSCSEDDLEQVPVKKPAAKPASKNNGAAKPSVAAKGLPAKSAPKAVAANKSAGAVAMAKTKPATTNVMPKLPSKFPVLRAAGGATTHASMPGKAPSNVNAVRAPMGVPTKLAQPSAPSAGLPAPINLLSNKKDDSDEALDENALQVCPIRLPVLPFDVFPPIWYTYFILE